MKHNVVAYHLGKRIKLKNIREKINFKILKSEHSFLLFELSENTLCYLKDYGSIVFVNSNEKQIQEIIELVVDSKVIIDNLPTENFIIQESPVEQFNVGFDIITVPKLTLDIAHIVMLNLGQSVVLDNYYDKSIALLDSTKIYASELEASGKIKLTRKKVEKFIGKTMNLKNDIAENLFIFEPTNLAWTDEDLAQLDYQMREELEIITRHHGLQHSLNVISENLDFFKDILQHRYSSTLEWIIIILILFEIIQVLFEKLF